MPTTVTTTPYGAAAYAALRDAVAAAKDGDPPRQVDVVVGAERIGVAARRALVRGGDGHRPGMAAIGVWTLRRLAEARAAASLLAAGRRPLTTPHLADAVRRALAAAPGPFAAVAEHAGTVRALAEAHRTLKHHDETTLAALGDEPVVAGTVEVHRRLVDELRVAAYDETDLLRAAAANLDDERRRLVVFLPQDLDPPEVALLRTLAIAGEVHLVVGLTGEHDADAGPPAVATTLGHRLEPADEAVPTAARVLHASDPDDEVRAVVRHVVADLATHEGHRISVLRPPAGPYARLLHEQLRRAERSESSNRPPSTSGCGSREPLLIRPCRRDGWRSRCSRSI